MDPEINKIIIAILLESFPDCNVKLNYAGQVELKKNIFNRFIVYITDGGTVLTDRVENQHWQWTGGGLIGIGIIRLVGHIFEDDNIESEISSTVDMVLTGLTPEGKKQYLDKFSEWEPQYKMKKKTHHWKITANILAIAIFFTMLITLPQKKYYSYYSDQENDVLKELSDYTNGTESVLRKTDGKVLVNDAKDVTLLTDHLFVAKVDNRDGIYNADGNRIYEFPYSGKTNASGLNPNCSRIFYYHEQLCEGDTATQESYVAIGGRLFKDHSHIEGISDNLIEVSGHLYYNDGSKAVLQQFRTAKLTCVFSYLIASLILINLGMYFFRRRMRRRGLMY